MDAVEVPLDSAIMSGVVNETAVGVDAAGSLSNVTHTMSIVWDPFT